MYSGPRRAEGVFSTKREPGSLDMTHVQMMQAVPNKNALLSHRVYSATQQMRCENIEVAATAAAFLGYSGWVLRMVLPGCCFSQSEGCPAT
jgi:hypothetical protein